MVTPGKVIKNALTCVSSDSGKKTHSAGDGPGRPLGHRAVGDYRPLGDGTVLTWVINPARSQRAGSGRAAHGRQDHPGQRDVKMKASIDMPRKSTLQPAACGGPLAAAAAGAPAGWWGWKRRRRGLALLGLALMMAAAAGLLSGCAEVYGKVSTDAAFTRMTYYGADTVAVLGSATNQSEPMAPPLWQITGTASYQADLTFVMTPTAILAAAPPPGRLPLPRHAGVRGRSASLQGHYRPVLVEIGRAAAALTWGHRRARMRVIPSSWSVLVTPPHPVALAHSTACRRVHAGRHTCAHGRGIAHSGGHLHTGAHCHGNPHRHPTVTPTATPRPKTIFIDAGHGGGDPGAVHAAPEGTADLVEKELKPGRGQAPGRTAAGQWVCGRLRPCDRRQRHRNRRHR